MQDRNLLGLQACERPHSLSCGAPEAVQGLLWGAHRCGTNPWMWHCCQGPPKAGSQGIGALRLRLWVSCPSCWMQGKPFIWAWKEREMQWVRQEGGKECERPRGQVTLAAQSSRSSAQHQDQTLQTPAEVAQSCFRSRSGALPPPKAMHS